MHLLRKISLLSLLYFILVPLVVAGSNCLLIKKKHPFHVGTIEWRLKTKNKKMEITVRLFTDDAELGIKKFAGKYIPLDSYRNDLQNKKTIESYFQQNLGIRFNDTSANLSYLGAQEDKESTYFFLLADVPTKFQKLETYCKILYDIYPDQVFIEHFYKDKNTFASSGKIVSPETKIIINIKKPQ